MMKIMLSEHRQWIIYTLVAVETSRELNCTYVILLLTGRYAKQIFPSRVFAKLCTHLL